MNLKKFLTTIFLTTTLVVPSLYSKSDDEKKEKKQKNLPYGLQKKVNNGGTLPPGWQKKLKRGEIAEQSILDNGIILKNPIYEDIKNTKIYKVQERIFRVANDTKEILDILK